MNCTTSLGDMPTAKSTQVSEGYDVTVGRMGTPLTGVDSRKSWL
ncbi:hypothetical protein MLPF_0360 [Mycobacterium lepromatosis]|nr:hypothetical protein MLPF_0360 [Mycobacterium lepromatosis]